MVAVLRSRIQDPGSGIADPGSQTHIFESLMTIFQIRSSINLCKLAHIFSSSVQNQNNFKFCGCKKRRTTNFFAPFFCCYFWFRDPVCKIWDLRFWIRDPRFWIRDPRFGIRDGQKSGTGIRDKHPGSATLDGSCSPERGAVGVVPYRRRPPNFQHSQSAALYVYISLCSGPAKISNPVTGLAQGTYSLTKNLFIKIKETFYCSVLIENPNAKD